MVYVQKYGGGQPAGRPERVFVFLLGLWTVSGLRTRALLPPSCFASPSDLSLLGFMPAFLSRPRVVAVSKGGVPVPPEALPSFLPVRFGRALPCPLCSSHCERRFA